MSVANFGNTVKVHYTVKLDDGKVVDSTPEDQPFQFTLGMGQAIPGFEQAVMGMKTGESKTVRVGAEEAYGPYFKELITELDRHQFPSDFKFEVGQHLEMPLPDGQSELMTVLKVTDTTLVMDRNHPLAGKDLTIDVALVEIL
ncbi:MAG: FKBP-type peptidyl-prolyl cis-trans isomerase [Nitrospirota bacterium]